MKQKLLWFVWFILAAVAVFVLRRRIIALWLKVPPPRNRVRIERGVQIVTPDGIRLASDHFAPITQRACPTILIRCPYGRNWRHGIFGLRVEFVAQRLAERGYHVITQDVRGRFDSDGEFEPYVNERNDGLATIEWLRQQPWFNGKLGMWGPSYLGIVQWAIADVPEMRALFPMITSSSLYDIVFPDGAFDLGLILRWITLLELGEKKRYRSLAFGLFLLLEMEWRVRRALMTLPVIEAQTRLGGANVPYYDRWLQETDPNSPLWRERLGGIDHAQVQSKIHLVGGWYDLFLRGLLNDYAAMKATGNQPYLTIGPWYHFSNVFLMWNTLPLAVEWFDAQLGKYTNRLREQPVRLFVMGADEWRDYPDYPPPAQPMSFYLTHDGSLSQTLSDTAADNFVYDPARPTPALGGNQFSLRAGPVDNRRLETRSDVLVYASPALETPLEMIGAIRLQLYAQSSMPYGDLYARLCDAYPDGHLVNICDGLTRFRPAVSGGSDAVLCVEIDMWATAYRVQPGHRLHLIISGGAHPRWCRHTGSENPLFDTDIRQTQHTIFHDHERPSMLVLPVIES
ncbi:MAG: CocE/NonD family hydrolase [Anaerolineae bacterium]|nr:CocE/NonD family hydrolase [Anaerolineae bacterium]